MKISLKQFAVLVLCVSGFLAFSCETEDDGQEGRPSIAGLYKFVSLTSATAVDLNKDGIASTNLMQEMEEYNFNYPAAKLELRPTKYNNTEHQLIDILFPHPNPTYDYELDPDRDVKYTRNALNGTGYTYTYDERTKAIEVVRPANHAQTEEEWGRLNSLTVQGTDQLAASVTKQYYDYQINGWQKLTIAVVYEKVE